MNNHNASAPSNHENSLSYLSRAFTQPFPNINPKCVSSKNRKHKKITQNKNSHGYDEISTKILRIHYISYTLTYICNRILSSGIFPTRLRFSEVKHMFKKRDKNMSDYRLVSLLTSFSNIFDKVIYEARF